MSGKGELVGNEDMHGFVIIQRPLAEDNQEFERDGAVMELSGEGRGHERYFFTIFAHERDGFDLVPEVAPDEGHELILF